MVPGTAFRPGLGLCARFHARVLLGRFVLTPAQTETNAAQFSALAERLVRCSGNLKYAAPPLPADPAELARLRAAIALAETPDGPGAAQALAAQVARFLADPLAALAQDQAGLPDRIATSLLPLIRPTR